METIEQAAAYVSHDVERSVVATVFADPSAWGVCASLQPNQFADTSLALIWEACGAVSLAGERVTAVTVTEELRRRKRDRTAFAQHGSADGLAMAWAIPIAALEGAVRTIRMLAAARAIARAAQRIVLTSRQTPAPAPEELIAMASREITQAAQSTGPTRGVSVGDAMLEWVREFEREPDERVRHARFGLGALDEKLGDGQGLQAGRLYVLAARPAMGKSSLAAAAVLATGRNGGRVLFFSLEMPRGEVVGRLVSVISKVDLGRINRHELAGGDMAALYGALNALHSLPVVIDDTPGPSMPWSEIRSRTLSEHLRGALSLVVIDHLNIIGRERGDRDDEITHLKRATSGAKALSKEIDAPVLLLVQLNRKLEDRADKRPQLADLRGSGSIEEDADVVMFIYRDEVYNPSSKAKGVAEIIFGKQRGGPIGTVELGWVAARTEFTEREHPQRPVVTPYPSHYDSESEPFDA